MPTVSVPVEDNRILLPVAVAVSTLKDHVNERTGEEELRQRRVGQRRPAGL